MKMKYLVFCTTLCFSALFTHAQAGKNNKRLVNDSTKERAAKADVYVAGKPIYDAAAIQKEKEVSLNKVPLKKKVVYKKRKRSIKKGH